MYAHVVCPKCGRRLPAAGELSVEDVAVPVYSCPECVTRATFAGEEVELPLTFILGPGGRPFDLAHPGDDIDLKPYGE
jgi:hypothetical protein